MNTRRIEPVFAGRLLQVQKIHTKLPNGHAVTLEVVKHPGAVLVVPFLRPTQVILLRQYRAVMQKYFYELPAGTLAVGEKPMRCARRELMEETGYAARQMKQLGVIYPAPGYTTEKITVFSACDLMPGRHEPEADEVIELLTVNRAQ
ncbi:MAG: NUDIX hydrolase, partial [Candidatus Omnitrophica bacterium]|nr:NUDIX hydrolase [Candidatus Omnitrophota bacterium]